MVNKYYDRFLSIKIARVLMKAAGFWSASSEKEEKLLRALLTYTVIAIATAIWTETCDFYFSIGDFYSMAYVACSVMPVMIVIVKVTTFLYHRQRIFSLIKFTEDHFWYVNYDEYGTKVLKEAEQKGLILVSMFTFFVSGTVFAYLITPIIENIGKNESDRILPFNIWIGVPASQSPYFEIAFTLAVVALLHAGLCFCCFDNLVGLLNIHVATQFRILGHRLKKIFASNAKEGSDYLKKGSAYEELKDCISQHRMLIEYVDTLENIFTYPTLCQLLVSSVMICVAGFQICQSQRTFMRRLIFIAHTNGCFFQLFVTTTTANEILLESSALGEEAFRAGWEATFYKAHKDAKLLILMIMLRSSRPCCISAGGFFPVTIETFKAVMSTAFSYFTLLRKFDLEGQ